MSDALFASYLLGYDLAKEENDTMLSFAEGDDIAEEAGPVQLRFDVPPDEAIDYFKRKKVMPSKTFYDIRDEARGAAFTVSGIYKQDVLESFRQEIEDALRVGWSQQKVVKNFKEILAGAGHRELGDSHLEVVARTNMAMAYGVGRRKQMEETAELLPFWQYSAVNDDRTRPTHRALDGIVLPADHPFWNEHYPPWSFNCRCSVFSLPEMPEDYNREFPNPDSQISYDKKGMPVRAQYGTGVYDLSAGKFTGVPRQTGLQKTIEEAAKKTYKTPKQVFKLEDDIRNDEYESAYVFNRDGKQIWQRQGARDRVRVQFAEKEKQMVKGGIITHNHPPNLKFEKSDPRYDGGSFSIEDIEISAFYELLEVRAVSQAFRHSIVAENGWDERINTYAEDEEITVFHKIYLDTYARVWRKLRAMILRKYTREEAIKKALANAETEVEHQTWKELAKEFGFKYRREQR